jgi:hypothetical protein
MASIQDQMNALQQPLDIPVVTADDIRKYAESQQETNFDAGAEFRNSLMQKVSEYDRADALQLAATLGITDTFRGVSQMLGFNKEEMAADQRILNKLMENPEWGNDIKYAYFGSLLLDPVGWLAPAGKAAQLAKAGYKLSKTQKAVRLSVNGAKWGGIGGLTGYVDTDSSGRVFNTLTGAAGGAVLAPALGVPAEAIGKFLASKTPKQLTDNPQGMIKELTGLDTASLTNPVKSFYYKNFQPAAQKYEDLKKQYVYKPLVLDNPIATLGGAGGGYIATTMFGDDIDQYINRLEDERDMDTGPWKSALKTTLLFGGAALGFGAFKKRFKGKNAQDFIGRRVIDNYKLSDEVVKLKEGAYLDFNDAAYKFTDIAERAKALSEDEKKILYYFLDGQVDSIAGLSKEAREIGAEARATIQETGQRMVDAGMLKESTFHQNMDSYIHRTYGEKLSPKLLKQLGIKVDDEVRKGEGQLKFIASELKGRGHIKDIPVKEKGRIAELEKLGYEKFGKQNNGIQSYRIQLTAEQRKALNEIEDAAFAIKATGDLMLNDLAAHKFYRDINTNFGYANAGELERLLKLSTNKKASADERAFASKLYKEYKDGGRKTYDELTPTEQADLVQMPVSKIPKTGLQKYGDLAGRWIPKDIAEDIIVARKFSDGEGILGSIYNNKYFQGYRRLNSIWKRTKTSWNPTVHTNNIVSNFFLLDAHDVPIDTFIENGFKVYTKKGQEELNKLDLGFGESNTYEDLVRLGVFDAGLAKAELKIGQADWTVEYLKEFHRLKLKRRTKDKDEATSIFERGQFEEDALGNTDDILEMSQNIAGRTYQKYVDWLNKKKIGEGAIGKKVAGKEALKNPFKWADKGLTDLYQREDQMFRVALYIDRVKKRMPELNQFTKGSAEYNNAIEQIKRSAAKEARKGFIDYNIQAPFINLLRDSALPFFSYTYRIMPILAKTATLKPSKFAKWAAIGYALDYAGRERTKEETEYERAVMREKRLARMFGLPFMPPTFIKVGDPLRSAEQFAQKRFDYALGWGLDKDPVTGNKLPQRSYYLDGTRFIPGGDVLGQTTPDEGGLIPGLPAPFQPSGGLAGEFLLSAFGIDPFTYKVIEDRDIINNAQFMISRFVPNNPLLGISGLQKLFGAKARTDFFDAYAHKKIMNALERRPDSSAYAPDLPVMVALLQTVGIKLWPFDKRKSFNVFSNKYKRDIGELSARIKREQTKLQSRYFGTLTYEERKSQTDKIVRDLQKQTEDIMLNLKATQSKRFKRRERKFGEVPADIIESMGESISETAREIFD